MCWIILISIHYIAFWMHLYLRDASFKIPCVQSLISTSVNASIAAWEWVWDPMSSIMPSITLSEQYNSESMIPILNVNADAETDDWCEHILSFLQQTFPFMDFELRDFCVLKQEENTWPWEVQSVYKKSITDIIHAQNSNISGLQNFEETFPYWQILRVLWPYKMFKNMIPHGLDPVP